MFLFFFFIFGFSRVFAQVTAVFFLHRKFESLRCSRGAVLFFFFSAWDGVVLGNNLKTAVPMQYHIQIEAFYHQWFFAYDGWARLRIAVQMDVIDFNMRAPVGMVFASTR